MNLIEHWRSGISRIIGKVKAAGLREREFIGCEVDLETARNAEMDVVAVLVTRTGSWSAGPRYWRKKGAGKKAVIK